VKQNVDILFYEMLSKKEKKKKKKKEKKKLCCKELSEIH